MHENQCTDLMLTVLPQSDSIAAKQMKIISIGNNRKSYRKSAARLFVRLA
jgi:hypothetical protein